jgi:SAM-dependent methyltransferase
VALLPQLGTPQQFETMRRLLRNLGFDEESVCARTGISSIFEFQTLNQGRTAGASLNDGLDVIIRLLLDSEQVPETQAEYLLPRETIATLESLRLIVQMGGHGDYFGTLRLSPVERLYIASDRSPPLDPEMLMHGSDFVPDAVTRRTGEFLKLLPRQECDTLLDLCCGSALKGLLYAGVARRVWACDFTARSIHFAKFNRQFNGINNVACVQGAIYEGLHGETFERIVAQLPDGDGNDVLRGIVEGLPQYLRPGGLFSVLLPCGEREPVQDRVRGWLGNQAGEFSVTVELLGDSCGAVSIVRV